jgi:ribonuclease P protein component
VPNPPLENLKKRSEFLTVSKAGHKWGTPAFLVLSYQQASEGPPRYGITASRKIGGAVERNRVKRRLRALLKEILPLKGHPGVDYVLIARKECLTRDFALMKQELEKALRKLHEKKVI